MPDITINAPPTSTGQAVQLYREGPNITDQAAPYVIVRKDRIQSAYVTASTFRIPVRAATTQNLFSLQNLTGSTVLVAVRRVLVTVDSIVAKAVLSPSIRLYRVNAASPTLGTVMTTLTRDSTQTQPAGTVVEARQDASADGTNSASALAATVAVPWYWQRTAPRLHTAAGQWLSDPLELIPGDPTYLDDFILNANQFLVVRAEAAAALTAADYHFYVNCAYEVYTRP